MPKFSDRSFNLLAQCHKDIQVVALSVIAKVDFTVLDSTIRTKEQQEQFIKEGKSKTLNSKHLLKPSYAIDIAPYPVDWNDRERFCYLAGYWLGVAERLKSLGIIKSSFKWGGDWNQNNITKDEKFSDVCHFEIVEDK